MSVRRRIAAPLVVLLAASLAACAPALPETVVPGTALTVGWAGGFTSVNPLASPTAGNIDIAEAIRGEFGDIVDGDFVPDESFGTAKIVADEPFTVRYDLAEPSWSDGIPLDAADLLLGWAGASGYFERAEKGGSDEVEADAESPLPRIDEFARAIEVRFPQPVMDWQLAVSAPVPAHVVGRRAFGTDDPMAAKQAVIRAIQEDDASALDEMTEVWNEGFEISDEGEIPSDMLLSSGPFVVDRISSDDAGQSVRLVPNPSYRGAVTPKVARIDLVPSGDEPLTAVGDTLDVVQVSPVKANHAPIGDLERRDFTVQTTHDGTVWAVLLNPSGIFARPQARIAFIRAVPARGMAERGAGEWASAYTGTTSMLAAPGSRAYDIVNEDSGFTGALGTPGEDAAVERHAAGIAPGSSVCVLFDRRSEFAAGAFAALRDAAAEGGWGVVDCGSDDYAAALEQRRWDAVITRVSIPRTPEQIAAQWGTEGGTSITRHADAARDALIAQLAQTPDVYEAREVRAQIEATIVRAAVALPIAANPRVTVVNRGVAGVTARDGAVAPLTYAAARWQAAP